MQVSADSSFWVLNTSDVVVYIASVVDGMLVSCHHRNVLPSISSRKSWISFLEHTTEGLSTIDGLCITWLDDTKEVMLTQAAHVDKVYEQFKAYMDPSKIRQLPGKENLRLCASGSNNIPHSPKLDLNTFHYRALVGGMSYISHGTRPEAIFMVNQLAKYTNEPTEEHWLVALECLSYLHATRCWGI